MCVLALVPVTLIPHSSSSVTFIPSLVVSIPLALPLLVVAIHDDDGVCFHWLLLLLPILVIVIDCASVVLIVCHSLPLVIVIISLID